MLSEKLLNWIETNSLSVKIETNKLLTIDDVGKFLVLDEKEKIFDEDFTLILTDSDYVLAEQVDYILFLFGDRFYYTDKLTKPDLQEFKYLGKVNTIMDQQDIPFVGVHGGYDLCNGSRRYDDWCKKAKFLGITTLGICEENTLAGVLPFYKSCDKYKINIVVGECVTVKNEFGNYQVRLYCKDKEVGWKNLLSINKYINVDNKKFITEEQLFSKSDGLICLLTPEVSLSQIYQRYKEKSKFSLYFQFDLTEWSSQDKEETVLANIQEYLDNYLTELLPVLVNDSYYLDKEDFRIRKLLNKIGHVGFKNQSKNQYFKNIDDYSNEIIEVFPDMGNALELLDILIETTIDVFKDLSFTLITGKTYLPKYEMSDSESLKFKTNEELLYDYIQRGLQTKVTDKGKHPKKYIDAVENEMKVIRSGGFIDYFLILADIYRYCDENGIWYGIGRGSAAGSVTLWLTGVTGIDPLQFSLFFERFLNAGRVEKAGTLPDVDCDFQTSRRPDVKKYIEEKYGHDQVISIGTYGTFKLRNALKDMGRVYGVDSSTVNYISPLLPDPEQQQPQPLSDLFIAASGNEKNRKTTQVKDFIQKYYEVIENLPLCLNQPKNSSIHAAGVVITPKEFGTAYEQIPIKEQDGILASEWEGHWVDEAGLLKLDILGLQQLDKFWSISELIKTNYNKIVKLEDIPLDDEKVYDLFKKGYNEDVFQLGAIGLKNYCKQLQPDTIEDLIATVALYRPGPIESGTHTKYVKVKNGEESPEPDQGCEEITKNTHGLIVYQEQVMQICQHIADFTLVEADDVRKALGKMKPEIVKGYKDTFLDRAVKNGYNRQNMEILWAKMEAFAAYAFNRSHAACYAITGYYSQWYKVHYPLEFWLTSLQFANDDARVDRVTEILNTSSISVKSVDINYSSVEFTASVENNAIYWSLLSVKWVGEEIVKTIIKERETNGSFYSLEEFYKRVKGQPGINTRSISHLIISGAFDSISESKFIEQRFKLLDDFHKLVNKPLKDEYVEMEKWREHQWVLAQKELTGFGIVSYREIILNSELSLKSQLYRTNKEILYDEEESIRTQEFVISGILEEVVERNSKNGPFAQLRIRDNTDPIYITVWNETYSVYKEKLVKSSIGGIVVLNGNLQDDTYKSQNVLHTHNKTKIDFI